MDDTRNTVGQGFDVPIRYKANLTIDEAVEYSGISRAGLLKMTNQYDCPFVLRLGNRRLIKRRALMNTLQNLILSNEDETLNREVKAYQEKLSSKANEIPIWERQWLTIEEASEYSGIARKKLRELSNTSGCPFAIWMGNKIHIIREKLDRYTETHNRI